MNNEDEIKIIISCDALKFEINIKRWAINSETKQYLIERVSEYINEVMASKDSDIN